MWIGNKPLGKVPQPVRGGGGGVKMLWNGTIHLLGVDLQDTKKENPENSRLTVWSNIFVTSTKARRLHCTVRFMLNDCCSYKFQA